ncbi:MAG: ChaN family lipoprotein [Gammaproteobacteria bacterium]
MKLLVWPALLLLGASLQPAVARADQAVLHMAIGDPERRDREVELVLDGITATATGDVIAPDRLVEELADVGLLFLGETHTNSGFHEVQLRVIRALHAAGREVLIGLEMFPYTQQASLDGWVDGHFTERGFVEQAGWYTYWGYRWEYYRDIFNFARDNGLRMHAINSPRDVVKAVRKKGFKNLTEEEAAHIPREVKPATEDQKRMYKGFFDEDDALHVSDKMLDGMLRAHTTWDATMGWNALQALVEHGGEDAIMVVLIGLGHVSYGLGAERQVAPYYDGGIASLIPLEVLDDEGEPVATVRASFANFLWGLPQEAHTVYPTLGVSLMGKIGDQPTKLIQVSKDSLAERAGLEVGDVLLAIDGRAIDSGETLRREFAPYRWGDVLIARIERDGEVREVVIPVRRSSGETGGSGQE